jgi:NADPH:quinone reductase-like Zn-dependent oxidoreductase
VRVADRDSFGIVRHRALFPGAPNEEETDVTKAVRFDHYGDVDVLEVVDVAPPVPGPGQLLIRVKAAGINPGEAKIRQGALAERFPATFPSGQGSDLAGIVEQLGPASTGAWSPGDEIIGFTNNRSSQAELVVVEQTDVVSKPSAVPWDVAGALFVAGTTAFAAVEALSLRRGDTVVVSAAAGGVGSLAVQLAALKGAEVVGIASEANHDWLRRHGVVPIAYGEGVIERIQAVVDHVDAFIDTFGGDYVEVALALGVQPNRIDTIANFAAEAKYGVKSDGNAVGGNAAVLVHLSRVVADGALEVPISRTYPLDEVREAYRELARGHLLGKIVLIP